MCFRMAKRIRHARNMRLRMAASQLSARTGSSSTGLPDNGETNRNNWLKKFLFILGAGSCHKGSLGATENSRAFENIAFSDSPSHLAQVAKFLPGVKADKSPSSSNNVPFAKRSETNCSLEAQRQGTKDSGTRSPPISSWLV